MSTNATIAIKRKDGTRTAIYLHYDGYIENAGITLQLAYNTADKVEKLLALGDLSTLYYHTDPTTSTHSFETPEHDVCVAYHRDRGEDFHQSDYKNEYNYTFDEYDGVWYVEREKLIRDTTAKTLLGISHSLEVYETELLLDAIAEVVKQGNIRWQADEYVKEEKDIFNTCLEKALEPRKEIIKKERATNSAYYLAYCD